MEYVSIIDGGALQRVRCGDVLHVGLTCCTCAQPSKWLIATARTEYRKEIEVPIHNCHHAVEIWLMLCLPSFTHNA
jgi:hypothetical protein